MTECGQMIEHEMIVANGHRFGVATCGEGDRLALCLHGFPECWYSWRHQMPVLASLGYRVWAPDLRGYGQSHRPPRVADYAIEALMDDVAGFIEAAGARSVFLLGHDWGAVIAWLFAMRNPGALERLSIMNVPHPACAQSNFSLRQLVRSWYALFFQIPRLPEKLLEWRGFDSIGRIFAETAVHPERFDAEVQRVYAENAARPGGMTAMLNYYRALVRGGGIRRQRALGYPVIETPTLMIWGEQDLALTRETTYGTERYVADLTLRYLRDASHWVQQDDPETVNRMLEAWLAGERVPQASELRLG